MNGWFMWIPSGFCESPIKKKKTPDPPKKKQWDNLEIWGKYNLQHPEKIFRHLFRGVAGILHSQNRPVWRVDLVPQPQPVVEKSGQRWPLIYIYLFIYLFILYIYIYIYIYILYYVYIYILCVYIYYVYIYILCIYIYYVYIYIMYIYIYIMYIYILCRYIYIYIMYIYIYYVYIYIMCIYIMSFPPKSIGELSHFRPKAPRRGRQSPPRLPVKAPAALPPRAAIWAHPPMWLSLSRNSLEVSEGSDGDGLDSEFLAIRAWNVGLRCVLSVCCICIYLYI